MLVSSAVISGLVICPVDIREVKISSYPAPGVSVTWVNMASVACKEHVP